MHFFFEIWLLWHFHLYSTISIQSWINYAQKIPLVIYNQTVQLVIFYLYLIFHACVQRFDVMERVCKNLEFRMHLN
jgi:hypothetical protein